MIPDEAVEAAHKAWREQSALDGSIFEYNLRAALEAAAPHLMAAAWDEGGRAAIEREHAYGREEKAKFSNPYKAAIK